MKNKILIILTGCIFTLCFSSCEKEEEALRFPLAKDQDIDPKKLEQAYNTAENITGIKSLLVSRNGELVSEGYFTEMGADDIYIVMSVTKSIISTLVGIAIEEGFLTGIDQKLSEFLTPLGYTLEGDKANITIKHLLTMSAGFEWNEFGGNYSYANWVNDDDQIAYCINGDLVNTPGEIFGYSSEEAHLLSVIITEATGMSTHDFAYEYLFKPLGIGYDDFGWGQFRQGYFNGGSDLYLIPRDMVKIGNLFLNNGEYNGNQIVPSAWVAEATSNHISTNVSWFGSSYGYLWWNDRIKGHDCYFANGYAGQFILVVPDLNLVITATSEVQGLGNNAGSQWEGVKNLILNDVMNSIE